MDQKRAPDAGFDGVAAVYPGNLPETLQNRTGDGIPMQSTADGLRYQSFVLDALHAILGCWLTSKTGIALSLTRGLADISAARALLAPSSISGSRSCSAVPAVADEVDPGSAPGGLATLHRLR